MFNQSWEGTQVCPTLGLALLPDSKSCEEWGLCEEQGPELPLRTLRQTPPQMEQGVKGSCLSTGNKLLLAGAMNEQEQWVRRELRA